MNLDADPRSLTTRDMPVPTCATCHMSGLEGMKVTHDVTERLSYYLFAPISEKRPGYRDGQTEMKELCLKCHGKSHVEKFYQESETLLLMGGAVLFLERRSDPDGDSRRNKVKVIWALVTAALLSAALSFAISA